MTVRRPKASVVIDPYETEISKNKKKEKEKGSTIACSDNSIRKWKVSEATTPVVTEFDKFSLKILSENSTNHSFGSLNETFEKNANFNFQNSYASSSIDSHTKKVSISAFPLFRTISPLKYNESLTMKREINVINESPIEESDQLCTNSTNNETFPKSTIPESCVQSIIKETPEPEESENSVESVIEEHHNIPSPAKASEIIEDIDDVQLSSAIDDNESTKSPSFNEFVSEKSSAVEVYKSPKHSSAVEVYKSPKHSSPVEVYKSPKHSSAVEVLKSSKDSSVVEVHKSPKHIEVNSRSKVGRQAKKNAKENITLQCQSFNEFRYPVDIDASQISVSQEIKKPKTIVVKSPKLKGPTPSVNGSVGQPSKLCDTTKAYLHSQESSLISSPLEQERLKSACQLPGRTSSIVPTQITSKKIENPALKDISNVIDNETTIKRQFFKSSFCERRRIEMERFTNLINNKPTEESANVIKPVTKTTKNNKSKKAKTSPKPRKSRTVKKKAQSKKKITEITEELICSGNSDEQQIDKITIEDSENAKCDQPIEKARGGSTHSSDDLFSFTPQFVQKRKLKTLKTKPKSKKSRLTKSSEIYDVLSNVSSPLSKRKSLISCKSNKKSIRLGDEVICGSESLVEMIINFESDIDRIKGIQQSMTYQLNQFKKILASSNMI